MSLEWRELLENAKKWAVEAGEEQVSRLEGPMKMESKTSDIDLVTEVDVWSEDFIMNRIKETYPDHGMVTEESGEHAGEAEYEWVIDPIDGTVNYARGLPVFCVSIGIRYKGETVAGVVHAPRIGETYEAVKGEGALLNGSKITVSKTSELSKSVLGTGFPYDKGTDPDNNLSYFNELLPRIGGIRRMGAAAMDLCQVAAGRFDGYWEMKLKAWDIEAGVLIVEEAGGSTFVKDEEKGFFVIAGNDEIFPRLQEVIQR